MAQPGQNSGEEVEMEEKLALRMYQISVYVSFEDHVDEVEGDVEEEVEHFHPMNPT